MLSILGVFLFAQTQRTVLIELFTSTSCPFCPGARLAADSVDKAKGDTVIMVDYVSGLSGSSGTAWGVRYNFYHDYYVPDSPAYVPWAWFDGGIYDILGGSLGWSSALYNEYYLKATYCQDTPAWCRFNNIVAEIDLDSGQGKIEVTVELLRDVDPEIAEPRVYLMVAERNVPFGSEHTPHAMRTLLPSTAQGISLSITSAGDTERVSESFSLSSLWKPESLEAYIWVQSYPNRRMYNAIRVPFTLVGTGVAEGSHPPKPRLWVEGDITHLTLPEDAVVELAFYDPVGRELGRESLKTAGGRVSFALPGSSGVIYVVARTPWGVLRAKAVKF